MPITFPIPPRTNAIWHPYRPVCVTTREAFIAKRDSAREDMARRMVANGATRVSLQLGNINEFWEKKLARYFSPKTGLVALEYDRWTKPGALVDISDYADLQHEMNLFEHTFRETIRKHCYVNQLNSGWSPPTITFLPALLELGVYQYIFGEHSPGLYVDTELTDPRIMALRMAHFDELPVVLSDKPRTSMHTYSVHPSIATDHDLLFHAPLAALVDPLDRRAMGALAYVLSTEKGGDILPKEWIDTLVERVLDGPANMYPGHFTGDPISDPLESWYVDVLNQFRHRTNQWTNMEVDPFSPAQRAEIGRLAEVTAEAVERFLPNNGVGNRVYLAWQQEVLEKPQTMAA